MEEILQQGATQGSPLMGERYPDNNPKSIIGIKKVPLHLVPPSLKIYAAMGFKDGDIKYGAYNWRENQVALSVYIAAVQRHLDSYWDGEEFAKDSGVHHLAHALACIGIIIDAKETGNLVDDRPSKGVASFLLDFLKEKDDAEKE